MTIVSSRDVKESKAGSAISARPERDQQYQTPSCVPDVQSDKFLPAWKELYQLAILEMDAENLMRRMDEAELAIVERALELRKEPRVVDHSKELAALAYSANFLAELRRLENTRLGSTLPSELG